MKIKRISIFLVLFVVSGLLGGFVANKFFRSQPALAQEGTPEALGAETLKIVDANGNIRMLLTTTDEKAGNIIFLDENKNVRAVYALSKTGEPVISITDTNEKQRFVIAIPDGDKPGIEMYDENEVKIWPKAGSTAPKSAPKAKPKK